MTNLSVPDGGHYFPEPLTAAETLSPPVLFELRIAPSNGGPLRPWERVGARMINRALETVEETYTWIHTGSPHYGSLRCSYKGFTSHNCDYSSGVHDSSVGKFMENKVRRCTFDERHCASGKKKKKKCSHCRK